ncbi:unnamed protein product [[Candida] boidinii]|nr:unnamed protein product [[Candida] boidinii]
MIEGIKRRKAEKISSDDKNNNKTPSTEKTKNNNTSLEKPEIRRLFQQRSVTTNRAGAAEKFKNTTNDVTKNKKLSNVLRRIQRCSYPPNSLGKVGRSLALRNSRLFSTISGNDHYSPLKHRQNIQNFKRYRSSFTRATTSKPRRPHGSSRYDDNVSNRERIMTPEELLQQAGNVDIEKVKSELAERNTIRYERPNAFWIENSLKWDLKKLQDRLAMSPIKDSKMVRDTLVMLSIYLIHLQVKNLL